MTSGAFSANTRLRNCRPNRSVRDEVAKTVFFSPNPSVRHLITIGTPHRGSSFANEYTRFLAQKVIKLPSRVLWVTQQLRMENPGFFRNTDLMTISTSIDSLAPDSPILPVMLDAQRSNSTQYHNVVGVVENKSWLGRFSEKGDGVVSYNSATRPDFQSEVVVDADHVSVHAHPRAILEVRRILLDQLAEARWAPPVTPVVHQEYRRDTPPQPVGATPAYNAQRMANPLP